MSDKFKISDLQSAKLQAEAKNVDKYAGNSDDAINKKEFKKLQALLNGNQELKAELENETDDIKKVFGYSGSVKAAKTEASEAPQRPYAHVNGASAYDTKATGKTPGELVKDAYYRYRGIDPVTREPLVDSEGHQYKRMSPKEAYEAVEKDLKGNKEFKKAVKDLRKYSIDTEAKMVVIDAIDRAKAKKSKEVKKEAEAILKAEGNWDKHTKKALNGNGHNWWANALDWVSFKDSDMKLIRKAQAAGNNAAEKATQSYTKKDFTDAIGKRSPLFKEDEQGHMAIEKLTNVQGEQLVTRKDDGTFDITKLSEFISTQIGSDNTLSRQQSKPDAELEAIRAELRKQGIELSKRDTKQLVEFCGYRVEHKNFLRAAYLGTLGGVAAAAGTATALATQGRDIVRGVMDARNYVELNLKMDMNAINSLLNDAEMKKLIENGAAQVNNINGGVQVIVDQQYVQPYFHVASKHIAMNVLKSAAVGAAIGVLAGLLEHGPSEEDIFSTRFECRTYEDFIKYVDARKELTDAQKIALKQVAIKFITEDKNGRPVEIQTQAPKRDAKGALVLDKAGKPIQQETTALAWDCEGFKDYLNKQAGYKSNLNRIELFKAIKDVPASEPVEPAPVPEQNPEQEPCTDCETKKDPGKDFSVQPREVKFRSWQDLVNGYDCLNDKEYNKSINGVSLKNRMVKVIQAIDISNVNSEDDLKKIYSIKTIAAFAEDAIRYGFDRAAANHPDLPVNKNEYTNVVTATAGLKGNAYVPTLYDENGKTCEWTKKADAKVKKGGTTTATLTKKGHTVNGQPTYWRKCPGSSDWEQIDESTYNALQK